MRYLFGFMCVLALGIMGCADTAGTGGSGGSAGSGGAAGTGGMAGSGGAGGLAGSGGTGGLAGSGGTVGNNPPVIDYVEWEYGLDCTGFGDTTIQVTVSAKDADDPTGETLTYSGVVDYCGDISITSTPSPVTQTLDCELFSGLTLLNVTVKDPQDNEDTIGATFESATCEAGCVENDEGEVGCP